MSFSLEYFDTESGSWEELPYRNWGRPRDKQAFDELTIVTDERFRDLSAETHVRAEADGRRVFAGKTSNPRERQGDGLIEIEAFSYGKFQLRTDIQLNAGSGDTNIDLMEQVVDQIQYMDDSGNLQDFNLNAPGTEAIDMENWSYDGKAMDAKRELERKIKWTFWTEPDGEAYYEPIGHGDTEEVIDTSQDAVRITNYEPEIVEDVVSKVRVRGVNPDGDKISVTTEAANPDSENFIPISVDFVLTEQEAEQIGESYLQPNKGKEIVLIKRFDGEPSRFNKEITLNDEKRTDGDEVFFVQGEEITSSGTLELTLEKAPRFGLEDIEMETEGELSSERASILAQSPQDVGSQPFDGETGSAPSDTGLVGGQFFQQSRVAPAHVLYMIGSEQTGTNNVTLTTDMPDPSDPGNDIFYAGAFLHIGIGNGTDSDWDDIDITVLDEDNNTIETADMSVDAGTTSNKVIELSSADFSTGDEVSVLIENNTTAFNSVDNDRFLSYLEVELDAYTSHVHDDDYNTDDFSHGGSGDPSGQHGASGETDEFEVELLNEDKDDR